VNPALRIEITDNAQSQISAAAAWWAEHRPAAPGAIREELDRVLDLLRVQPDIGILTRRATLSDVRRVTLSRIRYYVYYRVVGDALQLLGFWHTSRGSGPPM
jgi:plasmid stabilization system protein ParE